MANQKPTVAPDRIIERLVLRATTDDALKARLINDPAADLHEAFASAGYPADQLPSITFVSADLGVASGENVVVIPDEAPAEAELSEADLEAVAGGVQAESESWICTFTCDCFKSWAAVCIETT
ncbi:hypothetical protein B1759_10205 [Rubrivirga sp. SAORIC476]|uniref:hypothetical protein n=1 Tax=Rubrivirga sp. SAORIC476 TaxID=1961794 RepID=UPI000BA9B062|nr:hypothetical protein [Rubrivirga sp. SAORIC476]PAP81662.1 hypothetical protein B1759_10205 [Rubrivirga sp. SAORIC476]